MNRLRRLAARLVASLALAIPAVAGAATFSDVTLVAEPGLTFVEQAVELAAPGTYEVVLEDMGVPAPLTSVAIAASHEAELLGQLDAPGTFEVAAVSPLTVTIRVVGLPGAGQSSGRVRVIVRAQGGGSPLADFQADIADLGDAGNSGQVSFNSTFEVEQAGVHDCRLSDLAFPDTLLELEVTVSREDQPVCSLNATATSAQFDGTPGSYSIIAHARARSDPGAGLFGVEIGRSGQAVYQATVPVGTLGDAAPVALTASGSHSLSLVDQNFPNPLTRLGAILLRGIDALGRQDSAGTANFAGTPGDSTLFEFADTTASSGGSYGIQLAGPGGSLFSEVRVVSGPDPVDDDQAVYQFRVEVATAGEYTLDLTDFEFRTPFQSLEVFVTQGAQVLGSATPGDRLVFIAQPGFLVMTVVSKLAAPDAISLFGLRLTDLAGILVFEQTQASGAEFKAYTFDVADAHSYDVELTDMDFPASFSELSAAVTRGTRREGFVFGAGRFSFDAEPGRYYINVVATPHAGARHGLYAVSADLTPPAPVVDLDAASTMVDRGDSTTLTWNAAGATQCAASGGWTGSRALSGNEAVGPISARTIFRLSCTGDGGTTEVTVTVDVSARSGSGGGGAAGGVDLLALAALAVGLRRRRRPAA
jgi:hypothetical protein